MTYVSSQDETHVRKSVTTKSIPAAERAGDPNVGSPAAERRATRRDFDDARERNGRPLFLDVLDLRFNGRFHGNSPSLQFYARI